MKVTSASRQTVQSLGGQASIGLFGVSGYKALRQQLLLRRPASSVAKVQPASAASVRRLSLDDEPELAHSRWLADLAEGHGSPFDEDAAAFARSFAGVGYAEHLMALEG